jgi:carbon monoxide dehydrogenase subunit G
MAPCVRETNVKATPATIWKAAFEPMKWETWDPDVERLEEVSGSCVNGTSFLFVMKEGPVKKIPVTLSDIKENETLRFSGAAIGGLMKFDGFIEISEVDATTSKVKYTFDMTGFLGSVVAKLNPAPVVGGVEKGIENIKTLSEEAA